MSEKTLSDTLTLENDQLREANASLRACVAALEAALVLIRDRSKTTRVERWIDDAAGIHSIAFCALRDAGLSAKSETGGAR